MYNREVKNQFFAFCNEKARSQSTVLKASALFGRTEKIEKAKNKDICAFGRDELEAAVSGGLLDGRAFYTMFSILRQYVRWCVEAGVPGASDGIIGMEVPGLDIIRRRYVFSDLDLKRRLGEVYPDSEETADEPFLMFAWFAWAQIPVDETVEIMEDQIDTKSLSVKTGGRSYILSPYARRTAEFLVSAGSFRINNPNSVFDTNPRMSGSLVLRGTRGRKTVAGMNKQFAADFTRARNEGRTESALCYATISESSVFRDIYKFEIGGADPDMTITNEKQGSGASRENYERWKLAFVRT